MMEFDDDDDDFLASIDEPQIPRVIRSVFSPQQNDSYATRMNMDSKDAAEVCNARVELDNHDNEIIFISIQIFTHSYIHVTNNGNTEKSRSHRLICMTFPFFKTISYSSVKSA